MKRIHIKEYPTWWGYLMFTVGGSSLVFLGLGVGSEPTNWGFIGGFIICILILVIPTFVVEEDEGL